MAPALLNFNYIVFGRGESVSFIHVIYTHAPQQDTQRGICIFASHPFLPVVQITGGYGHAPGLAWHIDSPFMSDFSYQWRPVRLGRVDTRAYKVLRHLQGHYTQKLRGCTVTSR